jgi:lipopolysaccharide cholinephosphotransferase
MKRIDLNELREIELDMLIDFDKYCNKNGLRYYLAYGTLLGAVRHKGFIPWDDDIDVVMPRPDYERLLHLYKTTPIDKRINIATYRNNDSCICPFIKLQDLRTIGHEDDLKETFKTRVWIDIFPMDGIPKDEVERKKHFKVLKALKQKISLCTRPFVFCKNPARLAKRLFIFLFYGFVDIKKVNKKIEEKAMKYSYDESDYVGVMTFFSGEKEMMAKSIFENPVCLEFEGHKFYAPREYDKYLTRMYGDYMTLPPIEKRITHAYSAWWESENKQME